MEENRFQERETETNHGLAGALGRGKRRSRKVRAGAWLLGLLVLGVAGSQVLSAAETTSNSKVLLLSIDGMKPEYVLQADEHGLKIPHLRAMMAAGAYSSEVRGVLPANTFPGHITLITGAAPARHGIYHNRPFDPAGRSSGERWDWRYEHILTPTLWSIADAAGRRTAGVGWPASLGATDIHWNIPERVVGSDSAEIWSVVTPGLIDEVGEAARKRISEGDVKIATADWERTCYALEIMRAKKPDLLAVHLAAADGKQHRHGPFTEEAIVALEEIDMMVGKLTKAFRAEHPGAIVCVASDHGFSPVNQVLRIDAAFERAGLITFESRGKKYTDSTVGDWVAMRLPAAGSSPVFLKNPEDQEARERVRQVLHELAADPKNGIASILEPEEINRLGGYSKADFWIDLMPGFNASDHLDGALVAPRSPSGTHGYSPVHSEMNSAFFITGAGIRSGANLGQIDMRSIAPTLAKALGLALPTAEAPVLDVFGSQATAD